MAKALILLALPLLMGQMCSEMRIIDGDRLKSNSYLREMCYNTPTNDATVEPFITQDATIEHYLGIIENSRQQGMTADETRDLCWNNGMCSECWPAMVEHVYGETR